jgi:hypothetical protein
MEDLTKNNIENTIDNADLEGVRNKVEIKDESAISMSSPCLLFHHISSISHPES